MSSDQTDTGNWSDVILEQGAIRIAVKEKAVAMPAEF